MTATHQLAAIEHLNTSSHAQALQWLDGVYEHSPWVAEQALQPVSYTHLTLPTILRV